MSGESGAYRWWENYLVRYLMPSIAGALVVNWLVSIAGCDFRHLLLLDLGKDGLQTQTLVLLFLYGNLFCYISSYPILGFHVTRVIDFEGGYWKRKPLVDGYILTLVLSIVVLLTSPNVGSTRFYQLLPYILVSIFSGLQIYRIYLGMEQVSFDGLTGKISKIFAYTYSISRRRGVVEETVTTKQTSKNQQVSQSRQISQNLEDENDDSFDEEKEWQKKSRWRREVIDSYRHMREHGNSSFIFILEITLAGLCYFILVANEERNALFKLASIGVLLVIWALPAMFIHFVGQHVERRFSWYDKKIKKQP